MSAFYVGGMRLKIKTKKESRPSLAESGRDNMGQLQSFDGRIDSLLFDRSFQLSSPSSA